jgi:folate-dependent phosphoribosylglycinamide formyltransferase PurN
MRNVTFLSSGNGGNLKFLHLMQNKMHSADFVLSVIADRECGATLFARTNGIRYKIIEVTNNEQSNLSHFLAEFKPEIIFTTIHKVVSPAVLNTHGQKMVNLHYSLLPLHAGVIGMKGVESATTNHDALLGVTTHKVTSELDAGPIIIQSYFSNPNNLDLAIKASFRIGCLQVWSILNNHIESGVVATNRNSDLVENVVVHHSRPIIALPGFVNEVFWSQLSTL